MVQIADYKILRIDGSYSPFTLGINEEQSGEFTVINDYLAVDGFQRPFISFMFHPSSDASDLRYEVVVNGTMITSLEPISSDLKRANYATFDGSIINTIGNNLITFRVEGQNGAGEIEFSEIVLSFQRDIN